MSISATPIILTIEERAELEALARSTKTEHRTRFKARIVLMAADGAATRAIGRALGCTTGAASKWRVRCAKDRLAGFSEVGDRGAAAKYGKETDRRILALLDAAPPKGYANWTGPLIAKALGDVHVQYVWRLPHARRKSTFPAADPGVRATIPNSRPRRRKSLGSPWRRPTTPSCSLSTKSRPFRRSNAPKAI